MHIPSLSVTKLSHVRKSNSGVGESFTSDWKLNRQKGCFSELANSLEVTVNFSLQIMLFRLASSKTSSKVTIQLLLYRKKITLVILNSQLTNIRQVLSTISNKRIRQQSNPRFSQVR